MRNLIARYATHGLNHCLDTSSSILNISYQNKVFSFTYSKKKLESKFVLSPILEVVDYFGLKKNRTWKNVETIEE
jgi:hypothetical protein